MINISPIILGNRVAFNVNNSYTDSIGRTVVNSTSWKFFTITYPNNESEVITLSNETFNSSSPIVVLITAPSDTIVRDLMENNTLIGSHTFVDEQGLESTAYDIVSNGTTFFVTSTRIPYVFLNTNSTVVDAYVVMPETVASLNLNCSSDYDGFYSTLFSAFRFQSANETVMSQLTDAYCMSKKLL
jgi:hypothetical protein